MATQQDVLFEEWEGNGGKIGVITLNRPQVLNSLNHIMITSLHHKLKQWAAQSVIKAVLIRAVEGRAFCAGGDIRMTYERYRARDTQVNYFFREEYQLNRCIFHYPKPYIALLDGITMGGGAGISINGSHRVGTERLLFAMPETGIGFFPDVGGTYFLPRLPYQIGFYLGLTGAKIHAPECVAYELIDHVVASTTLPQLLTAFLQQPLSHLTHDSVSEMIKHFQTSVGTSALFSQQATINTCFSHASIEDIIQSLTQQDDAFAQQTAAVLAKKSPTSLKITLRALQEGLRLNFDDCMSQEYRLACRCLEGHDFMEGIRALIIDKDQTPNWQPATLDAVTPDFINHYFAPLSEELEANATK